MIKKNCLNFVLCFIVPLGHAHAQITETKLTPSGIGAGAWFGKSVSMSGDFAIVGAFGEDGSGLLSGSAYIYSRVGLSWSKQVKLTANDASKWDSFGISVSISGNYAIVGASGDRFVCPQSFPDRFG